MTINIDNNYVEGATVGAGVAAPDLPPLTVGHVKPEAGTVSVWVRCGWPEGEACPGQIILRAHARVPLRARPGVPHRSRPRRGQPPRLPPRRRRVPHLPHRPQLSRARRCCANARTLKAQLLVAIPDARATSAVSLRRAR